MQFSSARLCGIKIQYAYCHLTHYKHGRRFDNLLLWCGFLETKICTSSYVSKEMNKKKIMNSFVNYPNVSKLFLSLFSFVCYDWSVCSFSG